MGKVWLRKYGFHIGMVITLCSTVFVSSSFADNMNTFMLQQTIRNEGEANRQQREFETEMNRINEVGKEMDRSALCFSRADLAVKKRNKKKPKLTDSEEDDMVREIVNECCLQNGCKGI